MSGRGNPSRSQSLDEGYPLGTPFPHPIFSAVGAAADSASSTGGSGVSGGGGGGGGGSHSTLAAIHYETLSAANARGENSLWVQLKARIPDLRNATQYYAAEIQRYGATVVGGLSETISLGVGAAAAAASVTDFRTSSAAGGSREATEQRSSSGSTAAAAAPQSSGGTSESPVNTMSTSGTSTLTGSEVHYQPNPMGQLAIQVHHVEIVSIPPGTRSNLDSSASSAAVLNQEPAGLVFLCMAVEQGFAVFEATQHGVYEMAVELQVNQLISRGGGGGGAGGMTSVGQSPVSPFPDVYGSGATGVDHLNSTPPAVPGASMPSTKVVALQPLSKDILLFATQTHLATYSLTEKRLVGNPLALGGCPCGLNVMPPRHRHPSSPFFAHPLATSGADRSRLVGEQCFHIVVKFQEFCQLQIFRMEGQWISGGLGAGLKLVGFRFVEVGSILADKPVCDVTSRWIAYAGHPETAEALTDFSADRSETKAESVAKTVLSGLTQLKSNLWATTPNLQATATPLGTVAVYDVESQSDVSGFVAHNHPIECLRFDTTGMLLATASTAGTSINVFQITPTFPETSEQEFRATNATFGDAEDDDDDAEGGRDGDGDWEEVDISLQKSSTSGRRKNQGVGPAELELLGINPQSHTVDLPDTGEWFAAGPALLGDRGVKTERPSIHPRGTSVALLFRLTRGMTQATITDMRFGPLQSWISVCSSVGTCHFFSIPEEDRGFIGKRCKSRAAPSIGANCRARSAWSSTAVNPRVSYMPEVVPSAQGGIHAVDAVLASNSGTVTWIRCNETTGATILYTRSLDAFSGERVVASPPPPPVVSNSPPVPGSGPGKTQGHIKPLKPGTATAGDRLKEREWDALWRSEIELVTHPEGFGQVHIQGQGQCHTSSYSTVGGGQGGTSSTAGRRAPHGTSGGGEGKSDSAEDWDNI